VPTFERPESEKLEIGARDRLSVSTRRNTAQSRAAEPPPYFQQPRRSFRLCHSERRTASPAHASNEVWLASSVLEQQAAPRQTACSEVAWSSLATDSPWPVTQILYISLCLQAVNCCVDTTRLEYLTHTKRDNNASAARDSHFVIRAVRATVSRHATSDRDPCSAFNPEEPPGSAERDEIPHTERGNEMSGEISGCSYPPNLLPTRFQFEPAAGGATSQRSGQLFIIRASFPQRHGLATSRPCRCCFVRLCSEGSALVTPRFSTELAPDARSWADLLRLMPSCANARWVEFLLYAQNMPGRSGSRATAPELCIRSGHDAFRPHREPWPDLARSRASCACPLAFPCRSSLFSWAPRHPDVLDDCYSVQRLQALGLPGCWKSIPEVSFRSTSPALGNRLSPLCPIFPCRINISHPVCLPADLFGVPATSASRWIA